MILAVDVRLRALQHDVHSGGRGPEDRLPAHRGAGVVCACEAGQRELRPGRGAAEKRFVVEAETNIAGRA